MLGKTEQAGVLQAGSLRTKGGTHPEEAELWKEGNRSKSACISRSPLKKRRVEKSGMLWEAAVQGMLQGNVYYFLSDPQLGKNNDTGQKTTTQTSCKAARTPDQHPILPSPAKNDIRKRSHMMKSGSLFSTPHHFFAGTILCCTSGTIDARWCAKAQRGASTERTGISG